MHCFPLSRYLLICVRLLMCSLNLPQASPKLLSVNAAQIIIRNIPPLYILFPTKTWKTQHDFYIIFFFSIFCLFVLAQVAAAWRAGAFCQKTRSHLLLRKCLCAFHSTKLRKQITSHKAICFSTMWALGLVLVFYETFESSCDFSLSPVCLLQKLFRRLSTPIQTCQHLISKYCFRIVL